MKQRYILLPRSGIKSADPVTRSALRAIFDTARFGQEMAFEALGNRAMTVHDSTNEDGPKLVTLDPAAADEINARHGPYRALPEVIYQLPRVQASTMLSPPLGAGAIAFSVRVQDRASGAPLQNVAVYAFDNFAANTGVSGTTNASGLVNLQLPAGQIDRLYVLAPSGYWSGYRTSLPVANTTVALDALDINYPDAIRSMYPNRRYVPATGVKVGVLDTGVGPNSEINLLGGQCTVTGKPSNSFQDIQEHGTHVSGLIGGRGQAGPGVRGMAPNVPIYAYRVFDWNGNRLGASNYAILKAMILAQGERLDILNLSLGGGPWDQIVEESIADARANGILVVVAAGNDGRKPVAYPAAYTGAIAVSAMGRTGCFPAGSMDEGDVLRPPNNPADPDDFIAAFSNVGPQISCTGLGVGVLSTLPNNRFGPMSGTSMAAPMVAGCAASLLSQDAATYGMARNQARSDAIARLLQTSCNRRFNSPTFEGYGLPDPARV